MEGFATELERHREGVRRVRAGGSAVRVARELGRSEWWVHKWLRRWEGEEGLADRSRAPHHRPSATPAGVVEKILEVRCRLEKCQGPAGSAHGRPVELPVGGHQDCPLAASSCARVVRW
ncbi:MAG: leucine zipper domain-containing protein [Actinomycetota bacterium]